MGCYSGPVPSGGIVLNDHSPWRNALSPRWLSGCGLGHFLCSSRQSPSDTSVFSDPPPCFGRNPSLIADGYSTPPRHPAHSGWRPIFAVFLKHLHSFFWYQISNPGRLIEGMESLSSEQKQRLLGGTALEFLGVESSVFQSDATGAS